MPCHHAYVLLAGFKLTKRDTPNSMPKTENQGFKPRSCFSLPAPCCFFNVNCGWFIFLVCSTNLFPSYRNFRFRAFFCIVAFAFAASKSWTASAWCHKFRTNEDIGNGNISNWGMLYKPYFNQGVCRVNWPEAPCIVFFHCPHQSLRSLGCWLLGEKRPERSGELSLIKIKKSHLNSFNMWEPLLHPKNGQIPTTLHPKWCHKKESKVTSDCSWSNSFTLLIGRIHWASAINQQL